MMQQHSFVARQVGWAFAMVGFFVYSSAVHAAHPLITEDTGTQGTNHWQFELNTDHSRLRTDASFTRTKAANATLTYGLFDTLDIAVNYPHLNITTDDGTDITRNRGKGDVSLIAKWRFYEQEPLSLALKPVITFPTGDEARGLGNGRGTFALNLITTFEKEKFSWHTTIGATSNRNKIDARTRLWNVSTAVKYELAEQWTIAFDVGAYRNPTKDARRNPAFAVLGLIYSPTEKIDLDLGYKKGLNKAEVDRSIGVGFTLRW